MSEACDRSETDIRPGSSQSGSQYGRCDVVSLLLGRYPQVEIPGAVLSYVKEQELNGHRIRRAESGEPLNRFLERIGEVTCTP